MLPPLSILTHILRILIENLVIFLVTTLLVFALIRSIPGDPAREILGPYAPEEEVAALRHQMGLDRPFVAQYAQRLYETLTFDLGVSGGQRNTDQIVHATGVTVRLTVGATVLLLLLAVPIGLMSGLYPRSWFWNSTNFVIYVVSMVPIFLLAYGTFFLYDYTPILADVDDIAERGRTSLSAWQLYTVIYLTMITVLAVGDGTITELIRSIREETGRILESDFIRAVRANGGNVWKHIARNLFVPIATVLNLRILYLLGGAVVIESVFEYPGLGRLTVDAVSKREYNLVFSVAVISVVIVLMVTTVNKILITFIDPRSRD